MLENGQYKGAITVNKHEKIILEKLTEDPMLSQTELARMLNITRSSVSVYISYLMQKGYIRGRGYVIEDQKNVCVIGSSGVDYQTVMAENQIFTPLALDDYDLRVSYGGICKNIAESLTRFGLRTSCISAVGSDLLGQSLIEECKSAGVDTDNFMIVPSERTSTYLEIRTLDFNKIILASANMKLQRLITPEFLSSKQYKLRHAQLIVVEDSLSSETLKYVSSTYSPTLFVCTKPTRIKRYKDFLNQFNGMVTSLENAAAILGRETPDASDEKSVFRISQQLHAQLAGPLLVCYGDSHFCYTDDEASVICVFSDPTPRSALFSHYRDTVATGFIRSFINDDDPTTLLKAVSACREIAAQSTAFYSQGLCSELVEKMVCEKKFHFSYQ